MRPAALRVPEQSEILRARQVANLPHPPVVPPRLDPSATIANRFFERRSRRTIRAFGSPNTPRTVALARKPANEYPSDRRRCRFPDSAIAQRAEIERTSKLKKAPIHKLFRRYDPPKSPTRFPEDPLCFCSRCRCRDQQRVPAVPKAMAQARPFQQPAEYPRICSRCNSDQRRRSRTSRATRTPMLRLS